MNIQERLTAFAMLGAGWVMWLLVLLSVIILAIILERGWYLFRTRTDALALQQALRKRLAEGDYEGANKLLEECQAELTAEGLSFDKNIEAGVMIEIPSAFSTRGSRKKRGSFLGSILRKRAWRWPFFPDECTARRFRSRSFPSTAMTVPSSLFWRPARKELRGTGFISARLGRSPVFLPFPGSLFGSTGIKRKVPAGKLNLSLGSRPSPSNRSRSW